MKVMYPFANTVIELRKSNKTAMPTLIATKSIFVFFVFLLLVSLLRGILKVKHDEAIAKNLVSRNYQNNLYYHS